jgi:hypothetical protein
MDISPALFGKAFGEITDSYLNGIGMYISPVLHVLTLVLLVLLFIKEDKTKKYFTLYFLLNYVWIFIYVGIYMSYLFYEKMGASFLIFWGALPVLLLLIITQWFRELKVKKNNFVFKAIPFYRFIVIPIMLFGYWYPTFIWGSGFKLYARDFLFSSYGLMPCPTTMVVLGLLTLKYPHVNKGLYYSLMIFSIMVGTAQFTIGYVPDYPLAIIGYYSLLLVVIDKILQKRNRIIPNA